MLFVQGGLRPGDSVLVQGAGGGVATAALQIAAAMGARVIVSSRNKEKLSAAKMLGAEHGVHCATAELAKTVRNLTYKRGVDVVVNCVGGETWRSSRAALARGGRLVTCGAVAGAHPQSDLRRVFWNHLRIFAASSGTMHEFLQVLSFFSISKRKPIIDRVFPLKDAVSAQRRLEEGKQFGKIVLRMDA